MPPPRRSTLAASSLLALVAGGVALAAPLPGTGAGGPAFDFALVGDTPYGASAGDEHAAFDRLVRDVNGREGIRWVLHAGDVKGESSGCTRAVYRDRRRRLDAFDRPVVVTPGDNDWTDCHRSGGGSRDPLESLALFREVFYGEPGRALGGEPMEVTPQARTSGREGLPENVRWTRGGVVFATVHVVGSKNATNAFPGRGEDDAAEVERRTEAGVAWLHAAFDRAEEIGAPGVFVLIHADPGLERGTRPGDVHEAYLPFLEALEARARAFGGPVVLAHGDTHYFRVDKPALPRAAGPGDDGDASVLPNFTRLESFGSPRVHWVRVRVDPDDPEVFSFEPETVPGNGV